MGFQTTDQFKISEEVLSQEVNGETVLLNLEGESYFGLNEVGTRIWQLLQSGRSVSDMLSCLDEYDVSRKRLEKDLYELLGTLMDEGLLKSREA